MTHLSAKVGQREVRFCCEGRTIRLPRGEWPPEWLLGSHGEAIEAALVALLRREPVGTDLWLDVATVERAAIEWRRRFHRPG